MFLSNAFFFEAIVNGFAEERAAELEFAQGSLPVRDAREDGEEQVPLHGQRDVAVRPLVAEVRQRRALEPEPLDLDRRKYSRLFQQTII